MLQKFKYKHPGSYIEEVNVFRKFEILFSKYYWFSIYTDFDGFELGQLKKRKARLFGIIVLKLCSIILAMRCIVNVIWPNPYVRDLTCNAFHYLGNTTLINLAFASGSISGNLIIGLNVLYFNLRGQSSHYLLLNKLKYRRVKYKLNTKFRRKFFAKLDLISIVLSKQFIPIWFVYSFLFCTPTLIGYFDPELNFTPMGIIFWSVIISGWLWDFMSLLLVAMSSMAIVFLSLKYHFKQISEELIECLSENDYKKLNLVLKGHVLMENETKSINGEFKYYIHHIIKIVKPCLNTLVYLSHAPGTTPIMQFFATAIIFVICLTNFIVFHLCSSITTCAHKPQNYLYKNLLSKKRGGIPLIIQFKILRFIERLSGPEIGFYCYDLFPMTSYHFTDYVLDSIASYFLILKILKRNHFI